MNYKLHGLMVAFIVLVLDQFSKTLILGWFQYGEGREITSFFNLVRAHNTGAAFSFLANAGGWQRWFFTGLGVVASGFIVWMLRKHPAQKLFCFAISMILGGALGNVIDRLMHGYVVDMLDFHLGGRHFGSDLQWLGFPDWAGLAAAFGYRFLDVAGNEAIDTIGAALGDGHWLVRVRVDPERGRTPRLVSKIKDGKFVSPTIFDQYPELPADVEAGYATLKAGL